MTETKYCVDCKHHQWSALLFISECKKTEFKDLVTKVPKFKYCADLRADGGGCEVHAHWFEQREGKTE